MNLTSKIALAVSDKVLAAERWFGCGQWSAPFWFVGMEPGGGDDSYGTSRALGAPELLDLNAFSAACNYLYWLTERPPLQPTWKQLIRTVLGYEDVPPEREDVRRYQRDRLGRIGDNTLLVELSAIDARGLSAPVAEREHNRAERIATIAQRMKENQPKFVVFYGLKYTDEYALVAG